MIIGISIKPDGSKNHLFNSKVIQNEALNLNINEIVEVKVSDPYDDTDELRSIMKNHEDQNTYTTKEDDFELEGTSIAST